MADYEVFENFLDEQHFSQIQDFLMGNNFPWFYHSFILHSEQEADRFQFVHPFYVDGETSPYMDLISPVLGAINPTTIYKVRATMKGRTAEPELSGWHTDIPADEKVCMTGVFYINDNNGATVFEDGSKVESKANRFVAFRSDQKHSGLSNTDSKVRCLINFNYDTE